MRLMMHPAGRSRGNKKREEPGFGGWWSVEGRFIPIFGIIAPEDRGEEIGEVNFVNRSYFEKE